MSNARRWWRRRQVERLVLNHATWTGDSIAIIKRTNPTLAGVTWSKALAVMRAGADVGTGEAWHKASIEAVELVMAALEQEYRRLGDSR